MEYGLLGKKLSYSLSPLIHSKLGDYDYKIIEKKEDEIEDFFKNKDFKGINVTIPYKKIAKEYCNYLDESAKKTDCVNVVLNIDGKLHGYNTDYYGFLHTIEKFDIRAKEAVFLIVGNGATAKMVSSVLRDLGSTNIKNVSRSGKNKLDDYNYTKNANVLINCTPLGMYPNFEENYPIDISKLSNLELVIDLNYNPIKTKLILDAIENKCNFCSGLLMLVAQAKKTAELFGIESATRKEVDDIYLELKNKLLNIVFVGMPGSGKTVVSKEVSKLLNKEHIDIDKLIEKRANKSTENIILEHGINYFRDLEKEIIKENLLDFGKIISLGGGAIETRENLDYIRHNSTVVYLKRDINKLDTSKRPLSSGGLEVLEKMYEKRHPIYTKFSDYEVLNEKDINEVAKEVIFLYEKNINNKWTKY